MSLKKKLLLYNLVLSTFLVISGGVGYFGSQHTAEKYEHIVQVNMRVDEALGLMEQAKTRVLLNMYRLAHPGFTWEEREAILSMLSDRVQMFKRAEELLASIDQRETNDRGLYKQVTESWKVIEAHTQKFEEHVKAKTDEGLAAMQLLMKDDLERDRVKFDEAIKQLVDFHSAEAAKWVSAAQTTNKFSNTLGLLALAGALFASVAAGVIIGQAMTRQVSMLADRLTQSSSGVFQESVRVSSASTQLAAAMAEQASAIQETVSAVDEISAMVSKTADNSVNSQSESGRMSEVAMKGKQSLDQVVASIGAVSDGNTQILQQIEQGNIQLEKIVALINQIGEKTKVINDIVFQTKLLSFNASVEAARAGEHGKGFAVVAEEVGNLAAMSGNAAKEISDMLQASTTEVNMIVIESKEAIANLLARTKGKFEDSKNVANECAQIFDQIISQMEAVARNVNDIATASREQTTGIREINRVMSSLSDATQQNSSTTGETANSAMELKRQAEEVKVTVAELMTLVTGRVTEDSVIKPVLKAVDPKVMQKVVRANLEKPSLEKLLVKTESIKTDKIEKVDAEKKHDVIMTSKTKPIASSALIQAKRPSANVIALVDKKNAEKKAAAKAAIKKSEARVAAQKAAQPQSEAEAEIEQKQTVAKAVGSDVESVPSSDDDRFEKV